MATVPSRPNVLLVFMDDMTHWALASGQVATPNLDRLVQRGTRFSHAFNQGSWSGAVCVPARAMLLSGRTLFHAPRNTVENWAGISTPADVFRAAGYQTFFTGKWHQPEHLLHTAYDQVGPYGPGMLAPAADEHGCVDVGRPEPGNDWDPTDTTLGGHWLRDGDGQVVHSSQRWADAAIGFLTDRARRPAAVATAPGRDRARPFFLHLAFHAPHDPRQSPPAWLDAYPPQDIRIPPTAWPEHPFDQGDHLIRDELLAPIPRTEEAIRTHRREYFAILSHADAQIGRVLDELDRQGLTDDTVVAFSGDHGLALGEHGLMGKQSCYDHSVRVPLVLAGPGVPAGQVCDDLVYQASIYATLCDLTGVAPPAGLEFPSLVPLLARPDAAPPTEVAETAVFVGYKDFQRLIRTRTHALIAYRDARRVQLFDLTTDPWQAHDLADDPARRDLIDRLLARLRERQAALDDDGGDWTADIDERWFAS